MLLSSCMRSRCSPAHHIQALHISMLLRIHVPRLRTPLLTMCLPPCLHSLCDPCSPETCCAWRLWCWTCWASASTRPPHTPSCPCTSRWGTALVGVAVMCGVGFTCVERLHRPHNFQSRYKQGTVCGCCFVAILLLFSSQPCLCGSHWSSLAHRSSSMHCRAWVVSCFFNQVGTRSPS